MELHDRMKIARKNAGLYQKEVAELMDMPERTYAAYERGERDIGTKDLLKFCIVLNVSADWLLGNNKYSTPAGESKSAVLKDVEKKLSIMSDDDLSSVRREVDIRLAKSNVKK